ncbi:unnamed protein product, partial [Polarella glacialis]
MDAASDDEEVWTRPGPRAVDEPFLGPESSSSEPCPLSGRLAVCHSERSSLSPKGHATAPLGLHFSGGSGGLAQLSWRDGRFSDWSVQVGEKTYNLHAFLLARASLFFESHMSMASRTQAEEGAVPQKGSDLSEVLPQSCHTAFEDALDFMYSENQAGFEAPASKALLLLKIADILGIGGLFDAMGRRIEAGFSETAPLLLEQYCRFHIPGTDDGAALRRIRESAVELIVHKFQPFLTNTEMRIALLRLPACVLVEVLDNDDLLVANEDVIFDFVLARAEHPSSGSSSSEGGSEQLGQAALEASEVDGREAEEADEVMLGEPLVEELFVAEPLVEGLFVAEPLVEELFVAEPLVEELFVDEPLVEELFVAEPLVEELFVDDPLVVDEPLVEELFVDDQLVVNEPLVDEPLVEELLVAEPLVEEVFVAEPLVEELFVEKPLVEELFVAEPLVEELFVDEPLVEELFVAEPLVEELFVDDPLVVNEPLVEELFFEEPLAEELFVDEPLVEELFVGEPLAEKLFVVEPLVEELFVAEPLVEELFVDDPLVDDEPLVEELFVEEPLVEELFVDEPLVEVGEDALLLRNQPPGRALVDLWEVAESIPSADTSLRRNCLATESFKRPRKGASSRGEAPVGGAMANDDGLVDGKPPDETDNANYFCEYAYLYHQMDMLEDSHRTGSYFNAITWNPSCFKDKVVLDVGAGTCILSIFAARAGAKKVFAVEATDMAVRSRKIVEAQGLSDVIRVLQGTVETVELPCKVDVIVSEWMGYFLLRESMLDSVLVARDRFLKPGGSLFPSHATLYLAPLGSVKACHERLQTWEGEKEHFATFSSHNL